MTSALLAALAVAASAQTAEPRPIDLQEAFQLALKRSEQVAQDAEATNQALARVEELKSDILPHVAFIGSETLQENPETGYPSLDKTSYPQAQLTLTQPVFSGFREFLAFKQGRRQAEAFDLTERRAEALLYQDVAQAYLNLLQAQQEIDIRKSIVDATQDRIDQLKRWVNIGRSRESELLAARSQLAQVLSQVELSRGTEQVSQEGLKFLTGLDQDLKPAALPAPTLSPIEPFLAAAARRDDVVAAEKTLEASQLNTEIVRRQRWGTVGLTADYYVERYGFSTGTHYDGIFGVNVPIFDFGTISSQVSEAKAAERSSAQGVSLARRSAERDVRSAYRSLQTSLSAVAALVKADDLADANVKAQTQDYKLSLVTNLDVLDSLNTLESTRLLLNAAQQQAALARVQLDVAAGGGPASAQEPSR